MIDREDMLELTRRMTPSRTCFSRIAGCYLDEEGYEDGTFNIHFLKLDGAEKKKNLEIARTIPFSETNVQLKDYAFRKPQPGRDPVRMLLQGMLGTELKDDGLNSIFYEIAAEQYKAAGPYAIYLFYGAYDVPRKGTDKQRQDESEIVYRFIVGAFCPLAGEYEPGDPDYGFLYPAFSDRCPDDSAVQIFDRDPSRPQREMTLRLLS